MWRDYLYFTKNDKRGLIALALLLVVAISAYVSGHLISTSDNKEIPDSIYRHYREFSNILSTIDSINAAKHYTAAYKFSHKTKTDNNQTIKTFSAFNPNKDDSAMLTAAGLPPFIARNIVRYRAAGGKFKQREDLRKIYGMTDELYEKVLQHIIIDMTTMATAETATDSIYSKHNSTKYPAGTIIDLNKADTTELMKIPGIGRSYSKTIVAYREKLGGFTSVSQLSEIKHLPDSLQKWFKIEQNPEIKRININKASIERLTSHPYINFYMARAIIEYRKKYKRIEDVRQLEMLEEFDKKTLEKLMPYIEF